MSDGFPAFVQAIDIISYYKFQPGCNYVRLSIIHCWTTLIWNLSLAIFCQDQTYNCFPVPKWLLDFLIMLRHVNDFLLLNWSRLTKLFRWDVILGLRYNRASSKYLTCKFYDQRHVSFFGGLNFLPTLIVQALYQFTLKLYNVKYFFESTLFLTVIQPLSI